ncbi:MAG: hypothetical protein VX738_08765, partial [Planctomycetota bacterium]|nr:hypothetical protein [Planctomycetota bacterium]
MMNVKQKITACVLIVLCVVSGFAQQPKVDAVLSAIDRDSDGTLSERELKGAAASILMLDVDGDGIVSREEAQRRDRGSAGGSRLGGYKSPPPANNVPEHDYNIIVGRLTDQSVTARVLFHFDAEVSVTYGTVSGEHTGSIPPRSVASSKPFDFVLDGLSPNTRYFYQLMYQTAEQTRRSEEFTFHTKRSRGSSFVFTVQADSHLDENTSGDVYL